MNSPPQALLESATREVLAGLVERVTFHNAENGFCVLRIKARGHRELITVIGHAAVIVAGEWVTASSRSPWGFGPGVGRPGRFMILRRLSGQHTSG